VIRVVAVDPSYTRTGVATAGHTRSLVPPARTADLPPLARAHARRQWIRGQMAPLIRPADAIAVEGMFSSLNYGVIDRAELLGTLTDQAMTTGAAVIHIAPSSVKIYATGNGNAPKSAMLEAAHLACADDGAQLNTRPPTIDNDDTADAWWICALVHDLLGEPLLALPPHHRRALDAYRGPFTTTKPSPWVRTYDPASAARRALGG